MKKLIVFALWGIDEIYNAGAVENARLAREVYPGWTCRFYAATNCPAFNRLYEIPDCEVVPMKPPEGRGWYALFWRLLPAREPGVSRLLFRDCDGRLSDREAQAVKAWEASDKPLHAVRDVKEHETVSVVPSGLWGMKAGAVPDLHEKLWAWTGRHWNACWKKEDLPDERFLAEMVWAERKNDFLVHGFGGVPFPPHRPLEYGQFCGHPVGPDGKALVTVPEERLYRG